jgi:hypothetical protein
MYLLANTVLLVMLLGSTRRAALGKVPTLVWAGVLDVDRLPVRCMRVLIKLLPTVVALGIVADAVVLADSALGRLARHKVDVPAATA